MRPQGFLRIAFQFCPGEPMNSSIQPEMIRAEQIARCMNSWTIPISLTKGKRLLHEKQNICLTTVALLGHALRVLKKN